MSAVVTLIKNPERGFTVWLIKEIYLGPESTGVIVPNVDDMVLDWNSGTYRVSYVDPSSYIPTLTNVNLATLNLKQIGAGLANDLAMYQPSVIELAFLDTTVVPYTVSIDDRYRIYGIEAVSAKLFYGTDLSVDTGVVISKVYNGSGSFVSENITLVPIDSTNPAIKRPPIFNTNETLLDGETVTLVLYSQAGRAIGQHSFLIKNSSAIRGLGASSIVITDVQLVSNLLDEIQNDLINVPANIPITGGDFQARLIYSDGTDSLIMIGTPKCRLLGIDSFNTSLPTSSSKVVLTYYADINEPVVNVTNSLNRSITHIYNIRTVDNLLEYSYKVYICPTWNPTTQTYSNEYYLTNLAYDIFIKLANNQITVSLLGGGTIDYTPNSGAQKLALVVNLANVLPGHAGQQLIQTVTINYGSLMNIGWYIDYANINESVFGIRTYAEYSTIGQQALSIQSGCLSIEEWLGLLYTPLNALYDQSVRLSAPLPTHFQLNYNGVNSPIRRIDESWNIPLDSNFNTILTQFSTLKIIFLLPTVDSSVYHTLAIAPVKLQSSLTF